MENLNYIRKNMSDQIFVQIASYRDSELVPTIRNCIEQADNPKALTFGLCWQRDPSESLEEFAKDKQEVIGRAQEEGVERIFMPNVDKESIDQMLEVELRFPFCSSW